MKARLNTKFYLVALLLLILSAFAVYGIYFLNANEIRMEDGTPMGTGVKLLFSMMMGVIVLSWIVSFFTVLRQILCRHAFYMDEDGIHKSATAIIVLAFILVVPVTKIPYAAIEEIYEENGILTARLDKSKVEAPRLFHRFVRRDYHFFSGFTKETKDEILETVKLYRQDQSIPSRKAVML